MYFAIWKSKTGRFWYRIVGNNHETMAVSELLNSKQSALSSIATMKREAAAATVVDMTDKGQTADPR